MDLTPLIPLSFLGEGEEILERGEAPLLYTPPSLIKGRGLGGEVNSELRDRASLYQIL